MKAVRFHEYGGPEVLRYEDIETPVPGPGEVLLRVAGTSFNGVDGNIRGGFMRGPIPVTLPHTPGLDVAGTVEVIGSSTGWKMGDRVVGFLPMRGTGASAEYALAPAAVLAAAPASIPLADAAALPVVGLTAYQALFDHAGLKSGQRVLISGAGGAVGGYAVQLAKRAGAYVIATVSPSSRERILARGADEVIDHTSTKVGDALTENVDAVLNFAPIDPVEYDGLVAVVRDGGVVVGTTVWMPTPGDEARGVRAVDLFVDSNPGQLAELVRLVDAGELTVDIQQRVPLAELASIHAAATDGTLRGKVVVTTDAL